MHVYGSTHNSALLNFVSLIWSELIRQYSLPITLSCLPHKCRRLAALCDRLLWAWSAATLPSSLLQFGCTSPTAGWWCCDALSPCTGCATAVRYRAASARSLPASSRRWLDSAVPVCRSRWPVSDCWPQRRRPCMSILKQQSVTPNLVTTTTTTTTITTAFQTSPSPHIGVILPVGVSRLSSRSRSRSRHSRVLVSRRLKTLFPKYWSLGLGQPQSLRVCLGLEA